MSTTELNKKLKESFDDYAHNIDSIKIWFVRDLQKLLGYEKWRKFESVIAKAEIACANAGNSFGYHFVSSDKIIDLSKGAKRKVKDYIG